MVMRNGSEPALPELSLFTDLAESNGPFDCAFHVMEVLAASGNGLGEVLRDYAAQTCAQMESLMLACDQLGRGAVDGEAVAVLESAYHVLNSSITVLEMTPAAMLRNKAESLGPKEKISREEIVRIIRAFRQNPHLQSLMESEESCNLTLQKALAGQIVTSVPLLRTEIHAS